MSLDSFYRLRLTPKTKEILDEKKDSGSKYVDSINSIIELFGKLPEDVKHDLMTFSKGRVLQLSKQMELSESFTTSTMETSLDTYLAIIEYLNNGIPVSMEKIREELDMQKVKMKDGYLICPKDFVVVNPQDAKDMETAWVIECTNAKKYGIPHYVVFWRKKEDYEPAEVYDSYLLDQLLRRIPKFQRIVDLQVAPIYDPDDPPKMLNEKEFLAAPTIGYFPVHVHGDPKKPADYKPPCGVQIVKNQ